MKQIKCKKQKGSKEAKNGVKNDKGEEEASEEPPKGYIHVRARRGQATDSHSLAERVGSPPSLSLSLSLSVSLSFPHTKKEKQKKKNKSPGR